MERIIEYFQFYSGYTQPQALQQHYYKKMQCLYLDEKSYSDSIPAVTGMKPSTTQAIRHFSQRIVKANYGTARKIKVFYSKCVFQLIGKTAEE